MDLFDLWAHISYFLHDFKGYLFLLLISLIGFIFFSVRIYTSQTSELKKQIGIAGLFTLFLFILFYSGCEAYFRYKYDASDGLGFLQTNGRWTQRHVVYNTYGYRDHDFLTAKTPGVTRIGVYGDSLAYAQGIKDVKNRFSNLLEKKLRDAGHNVEVFNMGLPGLDTCGLLREYNRTKQLDFDIIVWEYYPNDVQPCGQSSGTKILQQSHLENPLVAFLSRKSFFFDFMYWRFSGTYENTFSKLRTADLSQYNNLPVLWQHQKDIAVISEKFHGSDGTRPVITIMFPFFVLLSANYPGTDVQHMMQEYFEEQNNIVINMLPLLIDKDKKQLMVNRFDSHPNEFVHALAAEQLYEKIVPLLHK